MLQRTKRGVLTELGQRLAPKFKFANDWRISSSLRMNHPGFAGGWLLDADLVQCCRQLRHATVHVVQLVEAEQADA